MAGRAKVSAPVEDNSPELLVNSARKSLRFEHLFGLFVRGVTDSGD